MSDFTMCDRCKEVLVPVVTIPLDVPGTYHFDGEDATTKIFEESICKTCAQRTT